jgi:Zn2+/Cd2+-exporting ATPase
MNAPACPRCVDHRSAVFHVAEMDCAHEVAILEKRLAPVEGVVALEADVLSRQLRVHFDGAQLTAAQIAEAVAQTGMRAWPVTAATPAAPVDTSSWPLVVATLACVAAAVVWILDGSDLLLRLLLIAAIGVVAPATLRRAWMAIRGRRLDMHVLMTVAVIGALAIDEWFEAATVLVLFGIAQALEARSLARARRAIAEVMDVTPPTADVRRAAVVTSVPVGQVRVGETVSVRPGARIPLDGVVTDGESTVNQAPVTGEADPVLKVTGDTVYAGSVNGA